MARYGLSALWVAHEVGFDLCPCASFLYANVFGTGGRLNPGCMKVISSALCQPLEGHDRIRDKELPRLLFRSLFTLSTSLARHRSRDLLGTEEHIERTMASLAPSGFPYPTSASSVEIVSGLFEHGIRSCPEGTAIQFECSRRVSYQDLGGMVDFMVSKLYGAVRFGQLVPVILPRSIQQIYVILAIFKLRAVSRRRDPGY